MKYSLTLSLFLGLVTKDATALRLQHHHKHHHGHKKMSQYDGDKQDWVPDCQPGRDPWAQATGGAGTGGSYPGVGIGCQGFAQQSSRAQYDGDKQAWVDACDPTQDTVAQKNPSGAGTWNGKETHGSFPGVGVECMGFAQKSSKSRYDGNTQAWVDDCQPGRDPLIQQNGQAGTGGSYPGVGIECQGFNKKPTKLAQYEDAWIDDCDPGRDPLVQANGGAGTVTSYPGVGINCQGFAQKKSKKHHKKSHKLVQYDGDNQAWIEHCDPAQDPWAQVNPSGAGTYNGPKTKGSFPGVGVECMGFAQKKSKSLAQYDGDKQAWVDPCDPTQDTVAQKNPSGAGTYDKGTGGTFPGVGVECMGFAQRHSNSYVQYDGDKQDWVDKCDGAQDPWAQKNPSGAGTYKDEKTGGSFPGVGVECQGFAQVKDDVTLPSGGNAAWPEKCDPAQDTVAQKNPSGAGTHDEKNKGSFPGVGVDCQGFTQTKDDVTLPSGGNAAWPEKCDPSQDTVAQKNPSGAGTYKDEKTGGSFPGVGVDCQGFAQTSKPTHRLRPETTFFKDCPNNLPDCNGTNGVEGVDCC